MEISARPDMRRRTATTETEEEKQEAQQLKKLELRLAGVRSTKAVIQQQLDQLNAEASKLELLERKSRQHVDAQSSKLTRLQQLQANEAKRLEEAEKRRVEQEAACRQHEEEERQRREHAVDSTPYGDDAELANLEDFLAVDSALL